ncbi:hypothetical protein ACN47E_004697 [Coniothyrium glycines]
MSTHDPEPPSPTAVPDRYAPSAHASRPRTMPDRQSTAAWSSPFRRLAASIARLPDGSVNALCGASAGIASGIVTCPLDVIKTRLQAQGSFRPRTYTGPTRAVYKGLTGTARIIWLEDGVRGLYRGLGPMLLGYIPTWAVYMSTYEYTKDTLNAHMENKWLARTLASITAGGCSTLVTNPIWVVKTRLMSQVSARASAEHRPPWHYKNTFDAFRKMYAKEGIASFYSGLSPALLGLAHVAIQFPLYEYLKMKFTGLEMGQTHADVEEVHWLSIALATVLSKITATSATYPHEVLRTRLQTQQRSLPTHSHDSHDHVVFRGGRQGTEYRGVVRTCVVIFQEEGWRAFYNGMGTNMIRAVPAAVTTMMTFEGLKILHYKLKTEGNKVIEEEES